MEEIIYNQYICRSIIEHALQQAAKKFPPTQHELNKYSCLKSEHITNMVLNAENNINDYNNHRLSEDTEIIHNRPVYSLHQPNNHKNYWHHHQGKSSNSALSSTASNWYSQGLGLVPLDRSQNFSDQQSQQDVVETKMREVKVHQENVRSKIYQSYKLGKTLKTANQFKPEGKNPAKIGIYDYDGELIEPHKGQPLRLPNHFQELQIEIDNKEQQPVAKPAPTKPKKKAKNVRFECGSKKEELQVHQSLFLKELSKIQWNNGVEPINKDDNKRKWAKNQIKKKRIDLLKMSEVPKHIRLQDLENCKNMARIESQISIGPPSQSLVAKSQNFFNKQDKKLAGPRTIKVQNNRALQFLMNELHMEDSNLCLPSKNNLVSLTKKSFKSIHC